MIDCIMCTRAIAGGSRCVTRVSNPRFVFWSFFLPTNVYLDPPATCFQLTKPIFDTPYPAFNTPHPVCDTPDPFRHSRCLWAPHHACAPSPRPLSTPQAWFLRPQTRFQHPTPHLRQSRRRKDNGDKRGTNDKSRLCLPLSALAPTHILLLAMWVGAQWKGTLYLK